MRYWLGRGAVDSGSRGWSPHEGTPGTKRDDPPFPEGRLGTPYHLKEWSRTSPRGQFYPALAARDRQARSDLQFHLLPSALVERERLRGWCFQ